MQNKTLIIFGSRPEYIKVQPLFDKLKADTLHIGQHVDIMTFKKSTYFIPIEAPKNDYDRLNSIISQIAQKTPEIINQYDSILVQGDTATVFGAALTAFQLGKKVIHLEAGLRTYDLQSPYPEEGYRQMVSRITDIHLCPTNFGKFVLEQERVSGEIHVVGNTVLDNLIDVESFYGNKVLVTIHRNENRDKINEILAEIDQVAEQHPEIEFIFPVHPNPIIKNAALKLKFVKARRAMEHKDLIDLLRQCKFVITDSGGIAEEASFLNKKVLVIRDKTERDEGVLSGHFQLCKVDEIIKNANYLLERNNFEIKTASPFGDGRSADRIKKILENE